MGMRPWKITQEHVVNAETPEDALRLVSEGRATFVSATITLKEKN